MAACFHMKNNLRSPGIDQFIEDSSNHEYPLNSGDIVVITSANGAYNAVTVGSNFYKGVTAAQASVNYVVPGEADTVEITLTSTAPAVTVNQNTNSTFGTLGLAHTASTAMQPTQPTSSPTTANMKSDSG